jgi:hypothetical protein
MITSRSWRVSRQPGGILSDVWQPLKARNLWLAWMVQAISCRVMRCRAMRKMASCQTYLPMDNLVRTSTLHTQDLQHFKQAASPSTTSTIT